MSCRRIRRELLWLVRFGDFDAGSAPHLDHLAACQGCRDEVGLDRALVRQLRTALAARVSDASPSASAWEGVLARMRQPEASVQRPWTARLASLLRAGSAMAGASLALILALNLEMAPIGPTPTPNSADLEAVTAGVPVRAGAGIRRGDGWAPAAGTEIDRQDAVAAFWIPTPSEQLPLARTTLAAPAGADVNAAPATDRDGGAGDNEPAVVLRWVPVDAVATSGSGQDDAEDASAEQVGPPAVTPAGAAS